MELSRVTGGAQKVPGPRQHLRQIPSLPLPRAAGLGTAAFVLCDPWLTRICTLAEEGLKLKIKKYLSIWKIHLGPLEVTELLFIELDDDRDP